MAYLPVLILATPNDEVALRVHAALLHRHGSDAVRLVSDADLVIARRWDHRISDHGAWTEVELADGRRLISTEIGVVLNRLRMVRPEHFTIWREADADYAVSETHALWLSWLHGIDAPVLNRATPRGLSGIERGDGEWLHLAGAAGLPTRDWQLSTNARRFAHPGYAAQPPASNGAEMLAVRQAGQGPALFMEPVEDASLAVTSIGQRLVGRGAGSWQRELRALRELIAEELFQAVFALRKGGSGHSKHDWRLCQVFDYIEIADEEVISAIVELLESYAFARVHGHRRARKSAQSDRPGTSLRP